MKTITLFLCLLSLSLSVSTLEQEPDHRLNKGWFDKSLNWVGGVVSGVIGDSKPNATNTTNNDSTIGSKSKEDVEKIRNFQDEADKIRGKVGLAAEAVKQQLSSVSMKAAENIENIKSLALKIDEVAQSVAKSIENAGNKMQSIAERAINTVENHVSKLIGGASPPPSSADNLSSNPLGNASSSTGNNSNSFANALNSSNPGNSSNINNSSSPSGASGSGGLSNSDGGFSLGNDTNISSNSSNSSSSFLGDNNGVEDLPESVFNGIPPFEAQVDFILLTKKGYPGYMSKAAVSKLEISKGSLSVFQSNGTNGSNSSNSSSLLQSAARSRMNRHRLTNDKQPLFKSTILEAKILDDVFFLHLERFNQIFRETKNTAAWNYNPFFEEINSFQPINTKRENCYLFVKSLMKTRYQTKGEFTITIICFENDTIKDAAEQTLMDTLTQALKVGDEDSFPFSEMERSFGVDYWDEEYGPDLDPKQFFIFILADRVAFFTSRTSALSLAEGFRYANIKGCSLKWNVTIPKEKHPRSECCISMSVEYSAKEIDETFICSYKKNSTICMQQVRMIQRSMKMGCIESLEAGEKAKQKYEEKIQKLQDSAKNDTDAAALLNSTNMSATKLDDKDKLKPVNPNDTNSSESNLTKDIDDAAKKEAEDLLSGLGVNLTSSNTSNSSNLSNDTNGSLNGNESSGNNSYPPNGDLSDDFNSTDGDNNNTNPGNRSGNTTNTTFENWTNSTNNTEKAGDKFKNLTKDQIGVNTKGEVIIKETGEVVTKGDGTAVRVDKDKVNENARNKTTTVKTETKTNTTNTTVNKTEPQIWTKNITTRNETSRNYSNNTTTKTVYNHTVVRNVTWTNKTTVTSRETVPAPPAGTKKYESYIKKSYNKEGDPVSNPAIRYRNDFTDFSALNENHECEEKFRLK